MIVEVLQNGYKNPLVSPRVECVNPCSRINRTQGFAFRPIRPYRCRYIRIEGDPLHSTQLSSDDMHGFRLITCSKHT